MMNEKLKKLYEHPLFHGIKTEAEAYDICKAEIQQFGKPGARTTPDSTHFDPKNCYIFFLLDEGDQNIIHRWFFVIAKVLRIHSNEFGPLNFGLKIFTLFY